MLDEGELSRHCFVLVFLMIDDVYGSPLLPVSMVGHSGDT